MRAGVRSGARPRRGRAGSARGPSRAGGAAFASPRRAAGELVGLLRERRAERGP